MAIKALKLHVAASWALVVLLAATTQQADAATSSGGCEVEYQACLQDTECGECFTSYDYQDYYECAKNVVEFSTSVRIDFCAMESTYACCLDSVSANDCMGNSAFVARHLCLIRAGSIYGEECTHLTCGDGIAGVVNNDAGEADDDTDGANGATDAPVEASPTGAPVPLPVAAAPSAAPVAAPVADPPTGAPVATPVATPPTVPAPVPAAPTAAETVEAGEATVVTTSANAFDERTDADGCAPDGCTAENTRDGDLADVSRWSCSGELVAEGGGAAGEECQIVYEFSEAQLLHSVAVAFLKGDTRTRTVNVNVNGVLHTAVESSGTTSGLETFELDAKGVLSLGLESSGLASEEFLSITEVEFQVSGVVASPPTATLPTPSPAAVTPAPVAEVGMPGPTANSPRGLELTPSPTGGGTASALPDGTDDDDAGAVDAGAADVDAAVASRYSTAVLTCALGLAAAVAAGL